MLDSVVAMLPQRVHCDTPAATHLGVLALRFHEGWPPMSGPCSQSTAQHSTAQHSTQLLHNHHHRGLLHRQGLRHATPAYPTVHMSVRVAPVCAICRYCYLPVLHVLPEISSVPVLQAPAPPWTQQLCALWVRAQLLHHLSLRASVFV
jgi:hypothetical protein